MRVRAVVVVWDCRCGGSGTFVKVGVLVPDEMFRWALSNGILGAVLVIFGCGRAVVLDSV